MSNKFVLFLVIVFLCLTQCTHRVRTETVQNKISIIYINNWNINQAAKVATLIRNEQKLLPTTILINGSIFSKLPITSLNKGIGEIEILNASSIDAVFFTPDFLRWGIRQSKELVRKSNFSCLTANIKEKTTNQTLGHEYLLKAVGKAQITIFGISYDSLNYYLLDTNLEFRNPDFVIFKLLPLLKNRTDFQFILTQTQDSLDIPVNYIFGAPVKNGIQLLPLNEPGIYKLEISFDDMKNITELKRTTISLDTLPDDSIIKAIIAKYQTTTDSILNIKFAPESGLHRPEAGRFDNTKSINFPAWATKTILEQNKTISFLYDLPLVSINPTIKDITIADLYNGLSEKDNPPILTIKGKDLRKFTKLLNPSIKPISDNEDYAILSTFRFLYQHPEIKFERIKISDFANWSAFQKQEEGGHR